MTDFETRYRYLLMLASDGLIIYDKQGRIIDFNEGVCTQLGYTKEEFSSLNLTDLLWEEDIKQRPLDFTALYSGKQVGDRRKIKTKTGKTYIVETSTIMLPDGNMMALAKDVTEKAAIEKALKLKEHAISSSISGIGMASLDGNILYVNDALCRIWGYADKKDMEGRTIFEMFDSEETGIILQRIIDSGVEYREALAKRKDGSTFYVALTGNVVKDKQNKPICVFGSFIDITESKRSREQIIREKELSDSVINTLPGIFYIYNKEGRFLRWNKNLEQVTGYNGPEIRNMIPLDFFDTEDKEYMYEKSKSTFAEGTAHAESFLFTKAGKKIPYYFNCIAVLYQGELCSMGMGIDITERFKAEKKLEESARQLRELSAHLQDVREEERTAIAREIHDELGQQLTVLKVDFSWLRSQLGNTDPQISKRLDNLETLLDNATGTVRRLSFALRPGMLDDLGLAETIDWYLHDYRERFNISTTFSNNIETETIPDKVKTAMFRIFQESLTNVIRHANATRADVELLEEAGQLVLRIEDNGQGFVPGDVTGKKTLGLIGMKERTLLMGGEFNINSNPGLGTVVTVTASIS